MQGHYSNFSIFPVSSSVRRIRAFQGSRPYSFSKKPVSRAGLTVKDVQDVFGFSTPQAIYKWQRGAALPTVDNLVVLAAIFGVKIDDILIFQDCGVIQISA